MSIGRCLHSFVSLTFYTSVKFVFGMFLNAEENVSVSMLDADSVIIQPTVVLSLVIATALQLLSAASKSKEMYLQKVLNVGNKSAKLFKM